MSDYTVRNTKNNIYFCFAGKGVKALKLSSILVFLQITFENHLWELSLRIIFEKTTISWNSRDTVRRKIVKIVSLFQTSPSSQVEMWEGTELRTVLRMDNTYIYIYIYSRVGRFCTFFECYAFAGTIILMT